MPCTPLLLLPVPVRARMAALWPSSVSPGQSGGPLFWQVIEQRGLPLPVDIYLEQGVPRPRAPLAPRPKGTAAADSTRTVDRLGGGGQRTQRPGVAAPRGIPWPGGQRPEPWVVPVQPAHQCGRHWPSTIQNVCYTFICCMLHLHLQSNRSSSLICE